MAGKNGKHKIIAGIADLTPDPANANRGTKRGLGLLDNSLRQYGAGRSILADKNGVVIAGNKTLDRAADIGLPVRVVETDGTELVVVQRTDLDIDSKQGRELAYADNRTSQVDMEWNPDQLLADVAAGVNLEQFFRPDELARYTAQLPQMDYEAMWQGMPEFENEAGAARTLHIHFPTLDDCANFCELLNVKITEKTKTIWYPSKPEQVKYTFTNDAS